MDIIASAISGRSPSLLVLAFRVSCAFGRFYSLCSSMPAEKLGSMVVKRWPKVLVQSLALYAAKVISVSSGGQLKRNGNATKPSPRPV